MYGRIIPTALAAAFALSACGSSKPPSPSPTPSIKFLTQTGPNMFSTSPLRQVRPLRTADNWPHLALSFREWQNVSLGIEGYKPFLKATSADGSVVLDRIVDINADAQTLPPGDYTLLAYYRTCDGDCSLLDGPQQFCAVQQVLEADQQYWLTVEIASKRCTFVKV